MTHADQFCKMKSPASLRSDLIAIPSERLIGFIGIRSTRRFSFETVRTVQKALLNLSASALLGTFGAGRRFIPAL